MIPREVSCGPYASFDIRKVRDIYDMWFAVVLKYTNNMLSERKGIGVIWSSYNY